MKKKYFLLLIPVIWFILGVLYSRTLEAFVGIGFFLMTLVSTIGLFGFFIAYIITNRVLFSLFIAFLSLILSFLFLLILSRF